MVTNAFSEQPRTFRPKREPACHSDHHNPPPPPYHPTRRKERKKRKKKGETAFKRKTQTKEFPSRIPADRQPKGVR